MNKFQKTIRKLGKVEDFEIKNNSLVLFLIGPSLFIYSHFINNYGIDTVKIQGARELFALLFLIVSILPFIFKQRIKHYFGWIVFLIMLLFSHHLIINLSINDFNIQFLLGFYVFNFGAILLFNNRTFINFFLVTTFAHLLQKMMVSNIDTVTFKAILSSFTLLYIFSFIILSGSTLFRKKIARLNKTLNKKSKLKTLDLEKKAKDLQEKNFDLEEFAKVVSHDLKTPLRNVLALSNWLQQDIEDNNTESIVTHLKLIEKEVIQMDLILEGVLKYSLQNEVSSSNEKVNLDDLVNDLKRLCENDKCSIIIKKELPVLEINKTQIQLVFQNLFQNAIKFNDKEICKVIVDYSLKDEFYTFSVADNGVGIEEKYYTKIFTLFQKLDIEKDTNSMGIGLSVVKKIINTNKGEIYLISKLNVGTTFYFTIPV
ncbi:sensor histidine kinase [Polaribacter glomeratus]|uniref:histidine kinase n=1 Tax=Polaribacter glomeratus TaxID=102 RepID=A0A2S7WYR0_9FLAO|nr:ATP-binding protein [Polaribacter glomeratus]PQJ82656.1 hypothetical protein BTO16_08750 [Polaribacter glomeratus]TXD64029.1 two-component sensor histidine kinase [Polaribacter glomeratus]